MNQRDLTLDFGPFRARLRTSIPHLRQAWDLLYPGQLGRAGAPFHDFDIAVEPPAGPRRWYRPQALFKIDGASPFKPLPRDQAVSLFEWGLNACIGTRAHQYLIFHAAAIERHGHAAILPGVSQAGKSTLTAALVHRGGWRLLSDELAMMRLDDGRIMPLARPIHLKNESIDLMRAYLPGAVISPPVRDTIKGTVALLKAPEASVARMREGATPRWIIFPRWRAVGEVEIAPVGRAATFIELGRNGINLSIHGRRGFTLAADLVERCETLSLRYSGLDDAIAAFDALASR